jgi:AraC family transcriptional regulator of adaptative response/methylated-DNA-[protein]-cysteine methyltransferase
MERRAIDYAVVPCELGFLLVAGSARGVCQVALGDSESELVALLRAEFPYAELRAAGERLAPWVAALQRAVAGEAPGSEVPLDVRGSRFQRRVWDAIAAIPRGETRSYGQLARAVGRPGAARAVGQACSANPVAVLVPCHRVVAAGGGEGGYRWGLARKRALLERESKESDLSLSLSGLSWRRGRFRAQPSPPTAPAPGA